MTRRWLNRAMRASGFRVTRWRPSNRFDAMRETVEMLHAQGYRPRIVIDAGANMGMWSRMAHDVFGDSQFILIEPQPACQPQLREAAAAIGKASVHAVAVSAPGRSRVGLVGGTAEGGTGVGVLEADADVAAEIECEATTLDALCAHTIRREDRALLKLDLEWHEMPALEGAPQLLGAVEVIVSESQIFPINDNDRAVFRDLVNLLHAAGFELYDLATMNGRRRDGRLTMVDAVFVRRDSPLAQDRWWV